MILLSKHDRYLVLILTILKYQKWDRAYFFVKALAGRVSEVGGGNKLYQHYTRTAGVLFGYRHLNTTGLHGLSNGINRHDQRK